MSNVDHSILDRIGRQVDNRGGPPDDPRMDERVKKLEELAEKTGDRLTSIEHDIGIIKSNYLTKADLADAMNGQIKWIVGTAIVLGSMGITIMTFVLNNAAPKAAPAPPQPFVIYAPAAPQAPAATVPPPAK